MIKTYPKECNPEQLNQFFESCIKACQKLFLNYVTQWEGGGGGGGGAHWSVLPQKMKQCKIIKNDKIVRLLVLFFSYKLAISFLRKLTYLALGLI